MNVKDFFSKHQKTILIAVGIVLVVAMGTSFANNAHLFQGLFPEKATPPGTPDPDPKSKSKGSPSAPQSSPLPIFVIPQNGSSPSPQPLIQKDLQISPGQKPSASGNAAPTPANQSGQQFLSGSNSASTPSFNLSGNIPINAGSIGIIGSSGNAVNSGAVNSGGVGISNGTPDNSLPQNQNNNGLSNNGGIVVNPPSNPQTLPVSSDTVAAPHIPVFSVGFSNLSVDPNPYTGRGKTNVTFQYTFTSGKGPEPVDAVVFKADDANQTPLKSWLAHLSSENINTLTWNGFVNNTQVAAANGDYIFQVTYAEKNPDTVVGGQKIKGIPTFYTKSIPFHIGEKTVVANQPAPAQNPQPVQPNPPVVDNAQPEPPVADNPQQNPQSPNDPHQNNESQPANDNSGTPAEESHVQNDQGTSVYQDTSTQNSSAFSDSTSNNSRAPAPSAVVIAPVAQPVLQNDQMCAGFLDVSVDDAACSAIIFVKNAKIMVGKELNRFAPNEDVQRDQAAKIVTEAFQSHHTNQDYCARNAVPFLDTHTKDWSRQYQCQVKIEKIMTGYLSGPFKGYFLPAKSVTRLEFLAILLRKLLTVDKTEKLPLDVSHIYDDVSPDNWGSRFAAYAYKNGLFAGTSLMGNKAMTRTEVAELLYKLHTLGKL